MNKVFKALTVATKAHEGQFRKVSGEPYITHPLKVSYLLASYKTSKNIEDLLCAALLHDCPEDTSLTFEYIAKEFGMLIASIVFELTTNEEEKIKMGKKEYLMKKMLGMSSWALTIKLVDRLANLTDAPTEKTKEDTKEILFFLEKNRKLSKTQKHIVKDLKEYL
jgi:(p)ppGpp synthase/HD superfamily hydrolase